MAKEDNQKPLDTATFQRVQKWYVLALLAIAVTVIVAQILIQSHLNSQLNDSRIINVAGRQRAYSQKLVKEVLLFQSVSKDINVRNSYSSEIKQVLALWKEAHQSLQLENSSLGVSKKASTNITLLFNDITPHHTAMINAANKILQLKSSDSLANNKQLNILLENEKVFLKKMDAIVNTYDALSKEKLQSLKQKEYLLLAFSLLILLLEVLFIFRPLSFQIKKTISKLLESQKKSENDAKEIKHLFQEKEKSLEALKDLNFVIDNAALFASTRKNESIVFISKKFLELLKIDTIDYRKSLSETLTNDLGQQQYLRELFTSKRASIRSEEIEILSHAGEKLWLDMSIIPMHQSSLEQNMLILCSDITQRKKTQQKIEQLTKENYEESIKQKQLQASQIVEGQEEERKRIAKDIHDGIGQMLTALKFNIESINLEDKNKSAEKISYLKNLTSDLIRGVRTATFNLTPPELSDHGIFPALQKMTTELAKLTGENILFENKASKNIRFDSLAETNIYRVTQEAINNAIKYGKSNYILVTINYNNKILSVTITDDGVGFDPELVSKKPKNNSEGGMGLFFMKERISYINGRLFINSILGEGTRITINYSLNNTNETYE